jgi:dCMP deaminase
MRCVVKQVVAYVPVIHAGYEEFLRRHADASEVLILGTGFRTFFPSLAKEIRALAPERAADHVGLVLRGARVRVVEPDDLPAALTADTVVMPDEEIMRQTAARYALDDVVFDRTFLRWDRPWSMAQRPVDYDGRVTSADLPKALIAEAQAAAAHSSDWWRQVGAVAVVDGEIVLRAWNRHHPTEHAPYIDGDPRNEFSRGVRADLSTAIHAEASVVAQAAARGLCLAGGDIYVTTFPCPACARLIAEVGFRRCLFAGPYSLLDGESVLRAAGVELIWVDLTE